MKKLLKTLGITIALTAISLAMRAKGRNKPEVFIDRNKVNLRAPLVELKGSTTLR